MKRTAGFRRGTLSTVSCGYSYTNGFVVLAEHLDMFRLGPIATGGKVKPSDNLTLTKRTLVEYSRDDITLFDGLCGWGGGGVNLADGFHDWGGGPCPFFSYTLAFAMQLRRSKENLIQGSRIVYSH
jgi:hypothetical protein